MSRFTIEDFINQECGGWNKDVLWDLRAELALIRRYAKRWAESQYSYIHMNTVVNDMEYSKRYPLRWVCNWCDRSHDGIVGTKEYEKIVHTCDCDVAKILDLERDEK